MSPDAIQRALEVAQAFDELGLAMIDVDLLARQDRVTLQLPEFRELPEALRGFLGTPTVVNVVDEELGYEEAAWTVHGVTVRCERWTEVTPQVPWPRTNTI